MLSSRLSFNKVRLTRIKPYILRKLYSDKPKEINEPIQGYKDKSDPFYLFLSNRNWSSAFEFWPNIVKKDNAFSFEFPHLDTLNLYHSSLSEIGSVGGKGEFLSKDMRYIAKKNFAMRIAYDGTQYHGFQYQPGPLSTVENDIHKMIPNTTIYGAGRTDRGVSAISQVLCFVVKKDNNNTFDLGQLEANIRKSEPVLAGKLRVDKIYRVPKSFNPRSSAKWRRYFYLFPLNHQDTSADTPNPFDVDVLFVSELLKRLENKDLCYFSFSRKSLGSKPEDAQNICRILRTSVPVIDLANPDKPPLYFDRRNTTTTTMDFNSDSARMESPAICFDIIGNRFIRNMMRVITGTCIQEALKPANERDPDSLLRICDTKNRLLTSRPLPPEPLCLAGVGYDANEFKIYKFMPQKQRDQILQSLGPLTTRQP